MCMICIHSCFQRVHVLNQNPKLENLILIAPPFIQTIPAQRLNFCSMGTLIKTFFAHHGICTCTPEHTNNLRQTNTHKCTTEHTQTFHCSFSSHLIIHSFSQCQTWAPWKAGTVWRSYFVLNLWFESLAYFFVDKSIFMNYKYSVKAISSNLMYDLVYFKCIISVS